MQYVTMLLVGTIEFFVLAKGDRKRETKKSFARSQDQPVNLKIKLETTKQH